MKFPSKSLDDRDCSKAKLKELFAKSDQDLYGSIARMISNLKLFGILICVIGVSCREEDRKHPSTNRDAHVRRRERPEIFGGKENKGSVLDVDAARSSVSDLQLLTFAESLYNMDDTEVSALLKNLISSAPLTANSENASKVTAALKRLLLQKSPEFSEILALLPPGYFSEMIVKQAFLEAHPKLNELLAVIDTIKEPDLAKAALNGGITSILVSEENDLDIGIAELQNLGRRGLSDQSFSVLLVAGYNSGKFSLEDVAQNINPDSSATINAMSRILSPDLLKDLTLLAYKSGRKIYPPSLKMMAHGFAQSDGASAILWAQELPVNDGSIAASAIFDEWMQADPLAASTFLGKMDRGKLRDTATMSLVKNCINNNGLDDARNWAAQIDDEKIRANALQLIKKNFGNSQKN